MKDLQNLKIIHGEVLTMDEQMNRYADGCLIIQQGVIVYAGAMHGAPDIPVDETIDASGKLVMPPFFNAHNHVPMSLLRGLGNDVPLQTWLEKFIWPAEQKLVNPDMVYWGTMLAGLEMIRSGTSVFADMYFFEAEVAKAAIELGMRCILGEAVLDFPTPNKQSPDEGFAYTEQLMDQFADSPLTSFSIPAHAPYTCSEQVLRQVAQFSSRYRIPATIHLSETRQETDEHVRRFGVTPARYLADLGFFDHHAVCYHCNFLTEEDIRIFKEYGVAAVTLPNSNGKLASGIAPVSELLNQQICVALGTDGAASNNNLSMLNDLQLMLKMQKVRHHDPRALSAKQALQIATINGAKAYRMEDRIGSLAPGKDADLILIDTLAPHMQPLYDPWAQAAYSMQNSDVNSMMIRGRFLMRERKILTIKEEMVLQQCRKMARGITC